MDTTSMKKRCSHCKLTKQLSDFTGIKSISRICRECTKITMLRHKYHLTWTEAELAYNLRNGDCNICEQPDKFGLCLDHDHRCCPGIKSCGKCIRGFICWNCNRGLGAFKDNLIFLQRALDYVQVGGYNDETRNFSASVPQGR